MKNIHVYLPWLCWGYLLLSFGLSFILPPWLAWENYGLEMMQNIVLAGLAVRSTIYWLQTKGMVGHASYLAISGYFILLLGREVSWGRVCMPTQIGEHGPMFVSMHELAYHTAIELAIGAYMLLVLWGLWRYIPWQSIWHWSAIPKHMLVILLVSAFLASLGDKGVFLNASYSAMIEEFSELLVYMLHGYFLIWYVRKIKP